MARIVLSTFGSLGDLHPYVALARALVARGHQAVLATHGQYRHRVERYGIEFVPIRPDFDDFGDVAEVMRRSVSGRRASEYVARQLVIPHLRASTADLLEACRGADALVAHLLSFGAPLVAETLRIPRILLLLQPVVLFSCTDPPLARELPAAALLQRLPPGAWRLLWGMARASSRGWFRELAALRREMGLPPDPRHPLMDGHSEVLNLAMFSEVLAPRQPDWPRNTVVAGFPLHDRDEFGAGMAGELRAFLDAGEPPIVFTLGSSGVWNAGSFYRDAAAAAETLGVRAVLLTGPEPRNVPPGLRPSAIAAEYAPHSELFPRARAIVHLGGIGTTGSALRSGKPMLVVPFTHDQPDNAARCARLGVARVLHPPFGAAKLTRALRGLLDDATIRARATEIGARVRHEDGARVGAEAIEAVLDRV